jgi:hypothetical protein
MRFFLSPVVFLAGIACMKYSFILTETFGKFDMAERYLGTGVGAGTYTFWKLFGLGLCTLSVFWLFGLLPSSAV